MSGRPSNSGGLGRTDGAEVFVSSVVAGARRSGHDVPGMNHWLLALCSRQFIARTLIRDFNASDVEAEGISRQTPWLAGASRIGPTMVVEPRDSDSPAR